MHHNNNHRFPLARKSVLAFLLGLCAALALSVHASPAQTDQHQLGTKYSPLSQITRDNVANLELAWEFHTGDLPENIDPMSLVAFEDQPSLIDGNLVVCSVKRKLTALDPATGEVRWQFNPQSPEVSTKKCRGIASWVDEEAPADSPCKTRIFLGTTDYKLFAIDAKTGFACDDFGYHGAVTMPVTKPELFPGEVVATSDPAVINGVVVVGSAVADMQRVDPPSGRVLAFDARSGNLLWEFDPVPRDPQDPAMSSWGKGTAGFGQGNVWSSMAVDQQLDLVYLPTTSTSDDYYGGNRPGDNHYTSSVVALRGATGEVVWHYQLVHHNVFDYDLPTRPMLIDYPHNGKMVPALVQNTKMGLIFIFDRATGEPLVPIEERPVPQNIKVPGEVLSPTQPFPVGMPALLKQGFELNDVWGFTFIDKWMCKRKARQYHAGPMYTPPSLEGTIMVPAAGGGPNWGGGGYDPDRNVMVIASNRVPTIIKMIPREEAPAPGTDESRIEGLSMTFQNPGSRYVTKVEPLLSRTGAPCSTPPWAALTAIDLVNKEVVWEVPLGNIRKMAGLPFDWYLGTPGAGGPLVTAGGLVFMGYTLDDTFRAFDLHTGDVLWQTDLPAAGTAIPVTYEVNGEQYVVIPAGGHSIYGSTMGDSVVAYKLKR